MTMNRPTLLLTALAALGCSSEAATTMLEEPISQAPADMSAGGGAATPQPGAQPATTDPASTGGSGTGPAAPGPATGGQPATPGTEPATGGSDTSGTGGMDDGSTGGEGNTDPMPAMDADKDGVTSDMDCDDNDPATFPGIREGCNQKDNDCDGTPDNDCINVPNCKMAEFQGHMYAFCTDNLTFPEARDQCHVLGMEAVALETKEENDWVNDNNTNADTWIGATDATDITVPYRQNQDPQNPTEGTFRWLMTETDFWAGGPHGGGGQPIDGAFWNWGTTGKGPQPNNLEGAYQGVNQSENCTVIRQSMGGKWADIGCTNRSGRATCEQRQ